MPNHDIVVIGASGGGVEALATLAHSLPPDLPAAVFVVLHTVPWDGSKLPEILSRAGPLPASSAENGKTFQQGRIYVAVPNQHLLLENGRMVLVHGPRENRVRPAVDPLFRSAALAYGPRVIGVVLTGSLDDGTLGLWHIKRRGGLAIVQDPNDARFPGMPSSAVENVGVDYCVPLFKIGPLLGNLVRTPAPKSEKYPASESMKIEEQIVKMENGRQAAGQLGRPSAFTCPECQGTLYEVHEGKLVSYRCRTGHAYGQSSLLADQMNAAEEALWAAMRALQEKSDLLRQASADHGEKNARRTHLKKLAQKADKQAAQVRDLIRENRGEQNFAL